MVEGGGLLNRYMVNSRIVGSNPTPSATILIGLETHRNQGIPGLSFSLYHTRLPYTNWLEEIAWRSVAKSACCDPMNHLGRANRYVRLRMFVLRRSKDK